MEFKVGDKVRMIRNTYGNRGKIGTLEKIDTSTMPYCVVFDDGRKEWCYGHEFKLLKEEKVMKFKVGDKVKVKDSWFGHDGQVGVVLDIDNYGPFNYNIKFDTEGDNERRDENFMGDSLELVTEEEEKEMKFKVGDKVKVRDSWFGHDGDIGTIVDYDGEPTYPFLVEFDVERQCVKEEIFNEESLELIEPEEEKVMKFKVGDKVKVSDSWRGNSGKVGTISRTDWGTMYKYIVEFEDADPESFKEEELESVKEKQQFTKSDLKTGMGVVLRNGRKGHVLVDTGCVDVIRFLENGNYSCLNDFSDDLTSDYEEEHDIVEVYFTEYQFKLLTDRVFDQDCVFKREEPTKMTMKEINEHFGKPIEIVE